MCLYECANVKIFAAKCTPRDNPVHDLTSLMHSLVLVLHDYQIFHYLFVYVLELLVVVYNSVETCTQELEFIRSIQSNIVYFGFKKLEPQPDLLARFVFMFNFYPLGVCSAFLPVSPFHRCSKNSA